MKIIISWCDILHCGRLCIDLWKLPAVSTFRVSDEMCCFLWNVGTYWPHYVTSLPSGQLIFTDTSMRTSTTTTNDCVKFCAERMLLFFVYRPYTSTDFTDRLIVGKKKKSVIKTKFCAECLLHVSDVWKLFVCFARCYISWNSTEFSCPTSEQCRQIEL